jgi:hypothetical protein
MRRGRPQAAMIAAALAKVGNRLPRYVRAASPERR